MYDLANHVCRMLIPALNQLGSPMNYKCTNKDSFYLQATCMYMYMYKYCCTQLYTCMYAYVRTYTQELAHVIHFLIKPDIVTTSLNKVASLASFQIAKMLH